MLPTQNGTDIQGFCAGDCPQMVRDFYADCPEPVQTVENVEMSKNTSKNQWGRGGSKRLGVRIFYG